MSEKEKITILTRKDLDISYFAGSGAGGQAKNKVKSGVKIIHRESGAIGQASDSRSLSENKQLAFQRLHSQPKFKVWLNKKIYEIREGESLEEKINKKVDEMMTEIQVQVKNEEGKWINE